jgi:hypothetical protein
VDYSFSAYYFMKPTLLLAAAFALCTSAALAQTVAPGTTPGATSGNPSNMPSAGSPTTDQQAPDSKRMDRMRDGKMSGNKRRMRDGNGTMKMKTKTAADGTMKTKM